MPEQADFLIEGALAIVTGDGAVLRDSSIAAFDGAIVFIGASTTLFEHVTRRPRAMRIDASGCTVFPSTTPLAIRTALDVIIAEGDQGHASLPASHSVRMEIKGGKIVRWEQVLSDPPNESGETTGPNGLS